VQRVNGDLASTVAFLSRPQSFAEGTARVEVIETHMSWVFLTDRHAYKLKKPVHDEYADLRSVEARRRNCLEELRVNRRFGEDVYLDCVALARAPDGSLALGGTGETVDWLVHMRRLPANRMLDRVIASGALTPSQLSPVIELLCRVYAKSPVPILAHDYRRRLIDLARESERVLSLPEFALPAAQIERVRARQRGFLDHAEVLAARAARVVEGHGDLRPEHVCLEGAPRLIDALEFSRDLRTLDPVDELGFLALECERLGAPEARQAILDTYTRVTGDRPLDNLVHFYQSLRALVRATLAIRHLLDPVCDSGRWRRRAQFYLDLAEVHTERY